METPIGFSGHDVSPKSRTSSEVELMETNAFAKASLTFAVPPVTHFFGSGTNGNWLIDWEYCVLTNAFKGVTHFFGSGTNGN